MMAKVRNAALAGVVLAGLGPAQAEEAGLVSLSFRELPVRVALQLLVEASKMQMLVSDSVSGTVTLELERMHRDDALALLLESRGLEARFSRGAWVVATPEEFRARDAARLESERAQESLAPLQWRRCRINCATASEMATLFSSGPSSVLSARGVIQADERTNSLIARDTAPRLEELAEMLAELELPATQVLIESRVVVANQNYGRNLGLRWGVSAARRRDEGSAVAVSGSGKATGSILESLQSSEGVPASLTSADVADRYSVNLPVAGASGQFSLALLHPDYLLDLELAAMQAEGQGRLISAPRVLAPTSATPASARVWKSPTRKRPRAAPRQHTSNTPRWAFR